MEIAYALPVSFDGAPALKTCAQVIGDLNTPPLLGQWNTIRNVILNDHLDTIRREVRNNLAQAMPDGPALLDGLWPSIRSSTKILLDLVESFRSQELQEHARSYCYWHYSNDILGHGKGISASALDRQFGSRFFHAFSTQNIGWACPCCNSLGHLLFSDVRSNAPASYIYSCPACSHREGAAIYGKAPDPKRTDCECATCRSVVKAVARELHPIAARIGIELANSLRDATLKAIRALPEAGAECRLPADRMPPDVMTFVRLARARPGEFLGTLLNEAFGKTYRGFDPFATRLSWHENLSTLLRFGVVEVGLNGDIHAMEEQEILDWSMIKSDPIFGVNMSDDQVQAEEVERSTAVTKLLQGYKSENTAAFLSWLKIFNEELRVDSFWFPMPVEFCWRVNEARVRELTMGTVNSQFASNEDHVYIYCFLPLEKSQLCRDVANFSDQVFRLTNNSLDLKPNKIKETLAGEFRTLRCEELLSSLEEAAPDLARSLPEIEKSMQVGHVSQKVPYFSDPKAKLLINLLYWRHSRDLLTEPEGMPQNAILKVFGIQQGQLRKVIDPVCIPWECPQCGNMAVLRDILLMHKRGVVAGSLCCNHCGHEEQIHEKEGRNALSCQCPACTERRREALESIRANTKKLNASLTEALLSDVKLEPKALSQSYGNYIFKLVACLREGYSLEECHRLLFSGTILDATGWGTEFSPRWALTAVEQGVLHLGPVERLTGDAARQFLLKALTHRVSRHCAANITSWGEFESLLLSDNIKTVYGAVRVLHHVTRYESLVVPIRYCATVNWEKVHGHESDELSSYQNSHSRDELLAHVTGNVPRTDHNPYDDWWPSPALVEDLRSEEEMKAINLLKSLGYQVLSPRN